MIETVYFKINVDDFDVYEWDRYNGLKPLNVISMKASIHKIIAKDDVNIRFDTICLDDDGKPFYKSFHEERLRFIRKEKSDE